MVLQEIYDMTAIGNQVGGTHYTSLKYQPVQLFVDTKCTPFQANIWKYISRYPYKNGEEDIKKCIHYAQLARDLNCMYTGNFRQAKSYVIDYCQANNLSIRQSFVMVYALFNNYEKVEEECLALINQEYQNKSLAKLKKAKFFYIFKEKFLYFKKKFYICVKKLKERYSRLEEQMAVIHTGSLSVDSISRLNKINIEMSNIETKLEKYGEYTIKSERYC